MREIVIAFLCVATLVGLFVSIRSCSEAEGPGTYELKQSETYKLHATGGFCSYHIDDGKSNLVAKGTWKNIENKSGTLHMGYFCILYKD